MTPASEGRFRQYGKKLMHANMRLVETPSAGGGDGRVALIRRGKTEKYQPISARQCLPIG